MTYHTRLPILFWLCGLCCVSIVHSACGDGEGVASSVECEKGLPCGSSCCGMHESCVYGNCLPSTYCFPNQYPCGSVCCESNEICDADSCRVIVYACDPETDAEFCTRMAGRDKVCGDVTAYNNCGQAVTLNCGTEACTGSTPECDSTYNTCVEHCEDETDTAFCARIAQQGKDCGTIKANNNCGTLVTVECGTSACREPTPNCDAISNKCVSEADCTHENKAQFCSRMATQHNKTCGTITGVDNCNSVVSYNCGSSYCRDGAICDIAENVCSCPTNYCNTHGICTVADGSPQCSCFVGFAPPNCAACDEDYAPYRDDCINEQLVPCINVDPPKNAFSIDSEVLVTYRSDDGWETPAECEWECETGFDEVDGSCTNEKRVHCDENDLPRNARLVSEEVTITYTADGGWTPPECKWVCEAGFAQVNGVECVEQSVCGVDGADATASVDGGCVDDARCMDECSD